MLLCFLSPRFRSDVTNRPCLGISTSESSRQCVIHDERSFFSAAQRDRYFPRLVVGIASIYSPKREPFSFLPLARFKESAAATTPTGSATFLPTTFSGTSFTALVTPSGSAAFDVVMPSGSSTELLPKKHTVIARAATTCLSSAQQGQDQTGQSATCSTCLPTYLTPSSCCLIGWPQCRAPSLLAAAAVEEWGQGCWVLLIRNT